MRRCRSSQIGVGRTLSSHAATSPPPRPPRAAAGTGAAGLPALLREFLEGVGRLRLLDFLARADGDFAAFGRDRQEFAGRWCAAIDAVLRARLALPPEQAGRA